MIFSDVPRSYYIVEKAYSLKTARSGFSLNLFRCFASKKDTASIPNATCSSKNNKEVFETKKNQGCKVLKTSKKKNKQKITLEKLVWHGKKMVYLHR